MVTSRRASRTVVVLAAIASVGLASACGSDSQAAQGTGGVEKPDISVAVFPSFNALGAEAANADGMFKSAGLNVSLTKVATPAEGMPQLLGGKVQFALMDMTVPAVAKSKGVPLVLVAPGAKGTPPKDGFGVGNLWVRAGSPIKTMKDVQNATFGIPQINSQIWVDIRSAVDEAGGDSSKIKFVEVPNTLSALKAGNVDVTTTSEPAGTAALKDTSIQRLAGYTAAGGDLAYAYVTTQEFAKQNPNTVKAFEQAILKANSEVNADQAKRVQVASTYVKAPKELLEKAHFPEFGTEPISSTSVQTALDRLMKYGLLDQAKAPKAAELLPASQ
ncbi:ABC transporter substrate-binding protein [Terrabacter aerolatus]|uniref:Myristoyl transferase n=1 Tax=Terrabacter aerolatus TaxID=422442 RepID=A0A512D4X9_9MICO|nr:ABC transporter substrate-binding protein [Terrabacter aerolatus]GEO31523.1 myristoyl transferase [Terrabacter aerolatus]